MKEDIEIDGLEENKPISPIFKTILSLFLVIIIILFIIPIYSIKYDPMPQDIPKLTDLIDMAQFKEAQQYGINNTFDINSRQDYLKLLNPSDPFTKQLAVKIVTQSCPEGGNKAKLCQAKAIYYFVRDNIEYVNDPIDSSAFSSFLKGGDYVETAEEVLMTGGSDCDGMAVLLANMEAAIGLPIKFVFIPHHVYIRIYLQDAPSKYFVDKKDNYGWIQLDATCKQCDFGKIPAENKENIVGIV
ncbi:MAG: transglutaminase-like domain-containing protein [Candidatus Woesearchaeota archaeon]